MIVTRTPLRISLGGGGTDLPFYCSKFGSSLITAAINKYIYITVGNRVEKSIKLNYSKTEIVDSVSEVQHPLIREALRLTGIKDSIEIHSIADIESGTGLGSSSSFLIGLLKALYYFKGEVVSKYKLAEDASYITMNVLKEPTGKQDQYAAAFGNLIHLKINTKGKVMVSPINITYNNLKKLERDLMMFYTGIKRDAIIVLQDQKDKSENKSKSDIFDYYHEIKKIGKDSLKFLEKGNLRRFGEWMNVHWELKRNITDKMSNPEIDRWYKIALENGAIGGKIIGAGGGGFLLLYVENNHDRIKSLMEKEGLIKTNFKFDFDGSKIVYDGKHF
ncbi:MAG: galactokinase [Candidatus Aenigmarchaeota archaeon]